MCDHLEPIIEFLEKEHNLKVVEVATGKGWGGGNLVNGEIPFDDVIKKMKLPRAVTVSKEHGLITCGMCWDNIAEYNRYHKKWQ